MKAQRGGLSTAAIELIAIVACVAGLALWSFRTGERVKDSEWKAKELARVQAEQMAKDAEHVRSEKAGAAVGIELRNQAIAYDQLQGSFNAYKRNHPLVAIAPVGPAQQPAAADGSAPPRVDSAAVPRITLTLGAVWMWNSALAGRDVPAGACGSADPAAGACAASAGIGLEDAWDNQSLNARTCAEDRLRHQRLIDYIQGRTKQ